MSTGQEAHGWDESPAAPPQTGIPALVLRSVVYVACDITAATLAKLSFSSSECFIFIY